MRNSRLLLAVAVVRAAAAQSCVQLSVDASRAINTVEPFFATWNIDSSRNRNFFDIDFSDPHILYLASQVGGSRIRFGGTGNDALYYGVGTAPACKPTNPTVYECLNATWWDNLVDLSTSAGSPLVVGLNIHPAGTVSPPKGAYVNAVLLTAPPAHAPPSPHPGPWDPTNAEALLAFAQSQGQGASIFGLELGNEQNSEMTAAQQAGALAVLAGVLDRVWDTTAAPRPVLLGPDTHSFHDGDEQANAATLVYIQDFVNATSGILGAGACVRNRSHADSIVPMDPPSPASPVTHHEYIEVTAQNALNATFLDASFAIATEVVKVRACAHLGLFFRCSFDGSLTRHRPCAL